MTPALECACEREKPEYGIAEYLHEVRIALEHMESMR
jgi:hypothetical protein